MSKSFSIFRLKLANVRFSIASHVGKRMFLSQAYHCEESWAKRLDSALLRNIKLDQYFIETDKKFGSKNLVSGVDIDLFANSVQDADQLDELEHLLYRFRRTKRSVELMDSTTYAVVRIFLKLKNYEALFRILEDPENYGIFPDSCSYNILMNTFIKENLPKEAMRVAVLIMLQEDFSNKISSLLALYSCQMFLKQNPLNTAEPETVQEEVVDEDEEEVQYVRVPFVRNAFFDDHFHLTNPRHLIGKTCFLAGLALQEDLLGRTYQLLGLGMYEKWEAALQFVNSLAGAKEIPILLSEGVEEFKRCMNFLQNEDMKKQFEDLFSKLEEDNMIKVGDLEHHLNLKMQDISAFEESDIQLQKEWFTEWEQKRTFALEKQNLEMEMENRLKEIARKKEYLYWKEKQLFFFENEDKILSEFEVAQEKISMLKSDEQIADSYMPPEVLKKPPGRQTRYEKIANVKKI